MNFFRYFLFLGLILTTSLSFCQTPGLIYKPAGNVLGKSVMDSNGDGYVSVTASGFIGTDYGVASELNMISLPVITSEVVADLDGGPSGGHTDLVSNGLNQSCYVLVKNVGGIDYLIVRFRLGSSSTAPKGYSLLLDTDSNSFNNYSATNPCFEREVILEPGNGVIVNALSASVSLLNSYSVANYHQRSIALSTNGGNPDYFYDMFVPLADIGAAGPVRMVVTTVLAAGKSAVEGPVSDINGVNDSAYGGNANLMYQDVVSTFPPVSLSSLTPGATFGNILTSIPTISGLLTTASTSITGTSQEADGTTITVYKNGISIGTATVTANAWTLTGVSGLIAGNIITAKAQATSKDLSSVSDDMVVTAVQSCYTPVPTALTRPGQQKIDGSYAHANGSAIVASTVRIRLYEQINNGTTITYTEISPASAIYVLVGGTWSFPTGLASNTFNTTTIVATATYASCVSGYSHVSKKSSGQVGTITVTPTMVTTQIIASPTIPRDVQVTNNNAAACYLMLYVNGIQVAVSPTTIAAGASYTFSYTGFVEGDIVTARAQSTTVDYWLSNATANLVVIASATPTSTAIITGTYIAGTGKTVTGTSIEDPGTIVNLYKNGTTLIGTATVNAFGSWSVSGLTLATSDVLKATAKATGKTVSGDSNLVTVAASAPTPPVVTGSIYAGATSISGTSGLGTVTIYIDGSPVGTATGASWTLSAISPLELYRGAVVTAKNTVSGIESVASNQTTVLGVVSFCITDTAGNPITNKQSGELFNIKITAIDGPACPGTVFTGFTGTVVLSSSTTILSGAGETANFVGGVLVSHGFSLGTPGTGVTISAINPNDPNATGMATLNAASSEWKGTTSTDFNTASNWVGNFVPLSGASISYFVPTDNDCYLDQDRTLGSIDFNSTTKKLKINNFTLTVNGAITGNSVSGGLFIGGGTSNLLFEGSGNGGTFYMDQTIPETSNSLNDLTINRLSSGSVTLGNALSIKEALAVTAGTFNTGDQVTFKSNAATTAIVSPVTGSINGKVTVERYIPARRAFRFLSSSVTTVTSIRQNWQEGVNNSTTVTNLNPNPGFGTHITGSTSGSNGFDATQTTNPSMFTFNNTTGAWGSSVANTDINTLVAGVPYRVMIRGDRSTNLNTNTPTPTNTTLRATGTLYTGTKTITDLSTVADGYSLIGNPYQSPVDMNQVLQASTNLNNVFYYLWDPRVNTRGGYVSVNVGTGVTNNGASSANKYLQPWQACFVKTNSIGAASLSFQESYKQVNTVNVDVFRTENPSSNLKLKLYEANTFSMNGNVADALLVEFGSGNSNNVNAYDANKFTNLDENFATNNNGTLLSIESRNLPQSDEIIPLHINQYRNDNYTIVAEGTNLNGLTPFLYDQYTQTYTGIPLNGSVAYNYSVITSDAQSIASNRFQIVFNQTVLSNESTELISATKLFPNPAKEGWFMINYMGGVQNMEIEVYNLLGQKIDCTVLNVDANNKKIEISKTTTNGVYWVKIRQDGQTLTKKLIIN